MASYWLDRVRQVSFDSYVGVPIGKFPEDLRVYEHLLWAMRADTVVEIGTQFGGSALWFRDRLATMARYGRIGSEGHVFAVDMSIDQARERLRATDPANITLLEGDVRDDEFVRRVADLIPPGSRCFVVEDSAHTYQTTLASLAGFAHLVPLGGYFVVEDGCVDVEEMRLTDGWPRGVLPAIRDWLATAPGSAFMVRRDLERYGLSCHPEGFLQRVRDDGEVRSRRSKRFHRRRLLPFGKAQ